MLSIADIELEIQNFSFNYENNDKGKLITDYCFFKEGQEEVVIKIEGKIKYKYFPFFLFLLHSLSEIKVKIIKKLILDDRNDNFEVYISKSEDDPVKMYGEYLSLSINIKGKFSFFVGIRKRNSLYKIKIPERIIISLDANYSINILREIEIKHKSETYDFHVGPDIGEWVMAFDPGTSGSCCAVATSRENIRIIGDHDQEPIFPSILSFDTRKNNLYNKKLEEWEPGTDYLFGITAETYLNHQAFVSFRSIKKLMGYKTKKTIQFTDGSRELSGIELTYLMLKSIYSECKNQLKNHSKERPDSFNPKRAVIAIPNNFTRIKIKDILTSIKMLDQFIDIKYIYEAEAVLVHHLMNNEIEKNENILVFDMGGSSINVTIMNIEKTQTIDTKYKINILSKLGYGIGGDTIDFALYKYIKENLGNISNEIGNLDLLNSTDRTFSKDTFQAMALHIKNEMKSGNNQEYYIHPATLCHDFYIWTKDKKLNNNPELSKKLEKHVRKETRNNIIINKISNELIFGNIIDSISESIDVSEIKHLNKVIISGRSTLYPQIIDTIIRTIESKLDITTFKKPNYLKLGGDEKKTAVATGACLYGLNSKSFILNHVRNNASFGIKRNTGVRGEEFEFNTLIRMGIPFSEIDGDYKTISEELYIKSDFAFDNNTVNFYQVMGSNPKELFLKKAFHKLNKIAALRINLATEKVAMQVSENDLVTCKIELNNKEKSEIIDAVRDLEITDENAEHYTWNVSN